MSRQGGVRPGASLRQGRSVHPPPRVTGEGREAFGVGKGGFLCAGKGAPMSGVAAWRFGCGCPARCRVTLVRLTGEPRFTSAYTAETRSTGATLAGALSLQCLFQYSAREAVLGERSIRTYCAWMSNDSTRVSFIEATNRQKDGYVISFGSQESHPHRRVLNIPVSLFLSKQT